MVSRPSWHLTVEGSDLLLRMIVGWEHRIHPDDREKAKAAYLATVETGQGYEHPVEMRLIAPDGTITDITYELQAERSSLGDCTGFVGVFSDVSTLRRLERDRMALERQRRSVPGLALLSVERD